MVKLRDNTMKELLLCMLEWHAIARSPKPVDIWHNGLRMHEWVAPQTWIELQKTFGQFGATDAQRAFEATIQLELTMYKLIQNKEVENRVSTSHLYFLRRALA